MAREARHALVRWNFGNSIAILANLGYFVLHYSDHWAADGKTFQRRGLKAIRLFCAAG
jgi:hypothetical protein